MSLSGPDDSQAAELAEEPYGGGASALCRRPCLDAGLRGQASGGAGDLPAGLPVVLAQCGWSMLYDAIHAAGTRDDTKFFLQMFDGTPDQLIEAVLADHNHHRCCEACGGARPSGEVHCCEREQR